MHIQYKKIVALLPLIFSLIQIDCVEAAPVTYGSKAAFDSAISALGLKVGGTNFDSFSNGQVINSGDQLFSGLSISSQLADRVDASGAPVPTLMEVSNAYTTTSNPNFLGTTDAHIFMDGDNLTLFSDKPREALGMYIISADALQDGDIFFQHNLIDYYVNLSINQTLNDGSNVYFIGIIDTAEFLYQRVMTASNGAFLYNVDDIVLGTIPEPSSISIVLLGLGILFFAFNRRITTSEIPFENERKISQVYFK
ncbi:hypothetical protein [Methylomonas albis]|uniref:PEP-CTERM sorting domain-containing protein n=1 Tax=Methylomonas albis TaxID=1854563 RepID=A0ABR9D6W5_9GAMM|nr:PEP-CTERM sorting domain-containing protein [Methylomonas albis]MBD9358815.1 PEP-CTERM sorting domain-containing protein [Methylomonas albis]CAD6882279.1 hypothetical protein [Methylomonas albis]